MQDPISTRYFVASRRIDDSRVSTSDRKCSGGPAGSHENGTRAIIRRESRPVFSAEFHYARRNWIPPINYPGWRESTRRFRESPAPLSDRNDSHGRLAFPPFVENLAGCSRASSSPPHSLSFSLSFPTQKTTPQASTIFRHVSPFERRSSVRVPRESVHARERVPTIFAEG